MTSDARPAMCKTTSPPYSKCESSQLKNPFQLMDDPFEMPRKRGVAWIPRVALLFTLLHTASVATAQSATACPWDGIKVPHREPIALNTSSRPAPTTALISNANHKVREAEALTGQTKTVELALLTEGREPMRFARARSDATPLSAVSVAWVLSPDQTDAAELRLTALEAMYALILRSDPARPYEISAGGSTKSSIQRRSRGCTAATRELESLRGQGSSCSEQQHPVDRMGERPGPAGGGCQAIQTDGGRSSPAAQWATGNGCVGCYQSRGPSRM